MHVAFIFKPPRLVFHGSFDRMDGRNKRSMEAQPSYTKYYALMHDALKRNVIHRRHNSTLSSRPDSLTRSKKRPFLRTSAEGVSNSATVP